MKNKIIFETVFMCLGFIGVVLYSYEILNNIPTPLKVLALIVNSIIVFSSFNNLKNIK